MHVSSVPGDASALAGLAVVIAGTPGSAQDGAKSAQVRCAMQPKVLIAYVTRSGSTEDVAEAMGKTIEDAEISVDVKPIGVVDAIAEGTSVILGAALYVGHFPREFHEFLNRFQRELESARPWIFVLGPTDKDPKHFTQAEEQARKELAKHPWLHAADVRVVGGKFDPHHLKLAFPFSLVMKFPGNPMRKMPASDTRDWDWICRWSQSIAEQVKKGPSANPGELAEYTLYKNSLLGK
jgi:menaquinone-dependent protoporphyrinogen oxidase